MFLAVGTPTLAALGLLSAVSAAFSAADAVVVVDGARFACGGTTPHAPRFAALRRS
ncbi:hypothetical protein [Actinomadura sp. 3N508]|uniref:hypothetical protein n=1 Tax=Actinomadura sp. 3N508 TaxID=3375153 RepID=UPI0037A54E48